MVGNSVLDRNEPLVSVLITNFNGMPYMAKAIEGIISQSYNNLEIIVVDDYSTDDSLKYLEAQSTKLPNLHYFQNNKKGRGNALNYGLSKCKGVYVAINDSDDYSLSDRIQKQVNFLEANPDYGLVGSMSQMIDLDTKEVLSNSSHRPVSNEDIRKYFIKGQPIQHVTVLYRKQLVDTFGGYNTKIKFLFDRDLFLRIAKVSKLHNLEDCLVHVGEHKNRFFKYTYSGIERNWLSTRYQLKAVLQMGFPFYHVFGILINFAYSTLRIVYLRLFTNQSIP